MPENEINDGCCQESNPQENREIFARAERTEDRCEAEPQQPCCEAETPTLINENFTRNITIHPLHYGFNVKIGCQNFAVETVDKLIKNLEAYLNDPLGTQRKWLSEKNLL